MYLLSCCEVFSHLKYILWYKSLHENSIISLLMNGWENSHCFDDYL